MGRSRFPGGKMIIAVGIFLALGGASAAAPAKSSGCDRSCLESTMQRFTETMAAHRFKAFPVAANAEIRENTKIVGLSATLWGKVRKVHSTLVFSDAVSGNVIGRAGVELDDGKPAYISTRLRIGRDGRVGDIEILSDASPMVRKDYVWYLDKALEAPVAPAQRTSRIALDALLHRYFDALATHQPTVADFDDQKCNRFHSGMQITNVVLQGFEEGSNRSCVRSMQGKLPWGPATEQRAPVIDEERGIVIGTMLLHYLGEPGQPTMYVHEVYKVVAGKIVMIDNIALKGPGMKTAGFVH
jgi:hypothetical protein